MSMIARDAESQSPDTATHRTNQAPRWLWVTSLLVVSVVVAPLAYITIEVARQPSWGLIWSGRTAELLFNTTVLVVAVTTTATTIGVGAAWAVTRVRLPMPALWTSVLALPLVIPSYVAALAYLAASGPNGMFAQLWSWPVPRLEGLLGSWLALSLTTYPYVFLVSVIALRRMDPSLEEVARSLGKSPLRGFFLVVVGQLRPAIGASGLLVALYTLSDFGAVSLMRYDTFTKAIYAQWAVRIDRTPALTLALVLILLAAIILWIEQRTRGRAEYFTKRPSRPPKRTRLSRGATWAVQGALGGLVVLALIVPISVLIFWLLRGLANDQTLTNVGLAGLRSVTVSGAAALAAAVAAIPVAVLFVRFPSRASRLMERAIWAVYALPHITVGVAILFFTVTLVRPIYQSLFVLIAAYVVLFLPQASGAVETALRQIDPHIEEAGRSMGVGQMRSFLRLTVPLIGRGIASGGALVFLTVMKELPATLLLRPTGYDTLALAIWQQANEGLYTRASSSALVLLAISAVPMFLIATRTIRS